MFSIKALTVSKKPKDDIITRLMVAVVLTSLLGGAILCSGIFYEPMVDNKEIPIAKYEMNDNSKRLSSMCQKPFEASFEQNLNVVKNYPKGDVDLYFQKIGGNKQYPDTLESFPVFVTAMDAGYYPYCQGMFKTLHSVLNADQNKNRSHIIVYDLGLTKRQLKELQEKCRCEVRRFPFELFPPFIRNLKTYAFKPLIVQMTFMEFGFVWWIDVSVQFLSVDLDNAVSYAKKNSILFFVEREFPGQLTISMQTDIRTFNFLEEDICKFRYFSEVWATTVLFHFDNVTKTVINAWATCALNEACIAPVGEEKLVCDYFDQEDGRCHRFDQSVLGIILRRLYHEQNDYPLVSILNDIYAIRRRERLNYF